MRHYDFVSNEIIRCETMRFFAEWIKKINGQDFINALNEISAIEADEKDKLYSEASLMEI